MQLDLGPGLKNGVTYLDTTGEGGVLRLFCQILHVICLIYDLSLCFYQNLEKTPL